MNQKQVYLLPLLLLCLAAGCNRHPAPLSFPEIDPEAAAARAFELYDQDRDGRLDAEEQLASPALAAAMPRLDANGDGQLTGDEIAARIRAWQESGTVIVDVIAEVTLDGRPLADAQITVDPEPFLGDAYSAAESSTDTAGVATFTNTGRRVPGLQLGFYRVRIHAPDRAGEERLPEQYNTRSTLGFEVAANTGNHPRFELTSTPQ